MKNIKSKISSLLITTAFGFGLFSCQTELLSPIPKTLFSDAVVFDTPDRVELQVNGLYASIKSGTFLGGRYHIYGDIRANDFLNRTNNGVTGLGVWAHTLTESSVNDVINMWGAAYSTINQINVFLDGVEANKDKFVAPAFPSTFSTTVAEYQGEARLLRALAYYSLLQYYARPYLDGNGSKPGLPLRLKGEKSSVDNDLARSTVAQVYSQILDDLNYAEQNLPLTYSDAALRVTRAHRNAAIALKTRVYLSMGNYQSVITEASKIVSASAPYTSATGVPHALTVSISDVFAVPQETLESILSFGFTAQDTPGGQNQLGFYYKGSAQGGGGEYGINKEGIVANTMDWPSTDARRKFIAESAGDVYLLKYPSGTPFTDKTPIIRYSEVLLSLAEAKARTNSTSEAIALLNAVRGRSDSSVKFESSSFANTDALINAILTERRIEFLGEGIRNIDIMRLLQAIPSKGAIVSVEPSSVNYIWPIPSTELAVNTLMTRNE